MHMFRKTVSTGLVISILLGVFAFSGCSNKDKGGIKKVSKDSVWFDSKTVELGEQYKDMELFYFQSEVIGVYKDGALIRAQGVYKPFWEIEGTEEASDANEFDNLDYYDLSGELIKSVDISKTVSGNDNRQLEDIILIGDEVKIKIIEYGNGKNTYYWAGVDPETGSIGEIEEIVIPSGDTAVDGDILAGDTCAVGDYYVTVSWHDNSFLISNNGKSKIVDPSVELPFTEILYIADHINISEKEIIFVCLSNDIRFLYLNVETGEVKNADEEYSWMNSINYSTQIACFDGKNYATDQEGIALFNDGQFFSAARAFENNRWKGNAYYRAGDYLSAIIFYEKSSESNTPLVIYNLANCYAMLGDLDTAIMLYEKVTATDNPHNYDATYNLNLLKQLQFEELTKQHAISAENVNLISTADGGNNECSKEEGCKDLNPQDLIRNRLRNMQNRSSLKKGPLKQW